MIKVSLRFLASLLNAEYIVAESVSDDIEITEVTIDTRKVTAGCLFVALKGERLMGMILPKMLLPQVLALCW